MEAGAAAAGAAWEYGPLATLAYELDKPIGTSFGDVEFYSSRLHGVTGRVLEPAVGTGRILIPLLEQGLSVRGYDTSATMLEQCRTNCARYGLTADVVEGDMTSYRDEHAYEAIVIPTGSFALLPDRDSALAALEAMHGNLTPGGRLIVDIEPPALRIDPGHDPVRHWWRDGDLLTLSTWQKTVDPIAQRSTSWLRYELWEAGTLSRTELQIFSLLWFGMAEFTAMLRHAGFTEVSVHGGYRVDHAPTPADDVWTFEAIRS
ncbi:class I SAM-dependent methyltransferase [Rhodococcus sp. ABRD24]|uniref:class I SAM-dependent methyltransferase n=1 Tax=Rhodococcus sp. ABRD24 TaxID=2507582 RepID=UPI00103DBE3B|nr:class I SAM-dependent methyltransferase [Rhodococcus sp. ABRD24]QBJ98565.1 class I SAM-dependent methyltransferase [Rhodococcus sp. ABRD24]